jgi:hypothetical protein
MHLLHPSQLNWLWLAVIPIVLWWLRAVGAGFWTFPLASAACFAERQQQVRLSHNTENDLVKNLVILHTAGHEASSSRSFGKAASSALEFASAQLCAGLRADGSPASSSAEQWQRLIRWASEERLILPPDYPQPVRSDTSEHDVRFDEVTGRWFKYTFEGLCGFSVDWDEKSPPHLRMATPVEYLRRLVLQNEVFADDIELVGLWSRGDGAWRVVTSQPDVAGEPATRVQILEGLRAHGFQPLPVPGPNNAPAFRRLNTVVWDAHPGNFVMTSDGVLVPIDLIITELPDASAS